MQGSNRLRLPCSFVYHLAALFSRHISFEIRFRALRNGLSLSLPPNFTVLCASRLAPTFFSSDYVVSLAVCCFLLSCADVRLDRIETLSAGSVALPLSSLRSAGHSGCLSGFRKARFLRPFFLAPPATRCYAPVIASLVSP